MSDETVLVQIDKPQPAYVAGALLAGTYRLLAAERPEVQRFEVSVLWRTEGKGEEDLGVHFFETLTLPEEERLDGDRPRHFSTILPPSPLSYDGFLIKIHWLVRVRAFLVNGPELVGEAPFQLGNVARSQETSE